MVEKDCYQLYFDALPNALEMCKQRGDKYAFGYTSNLDVILKWEALTIQNLIDGYLIEEPVLKVDDVIRSMHDLARIIVYYAMQGIGGEVDIVDRNVVTYLETKFYTTHALGGTCAQGAAALNVLGFPVIAHFTDKSQEVCSLVSGDHFYIAAEGTIECIKGVKTRERANKHIILQFNKGDSFCIKNVIYTIPESNRLIMDYDQVTKYMYLDEAYLRAVERDARNIRSYDISGFSTILDIDVLEERVDRLGRHYDMLKTLNPTCLLYLESAHYINPVCRDRVFSVLGSKMDILGMNEEELIELTKALGCSVEMEELSSILKGLTILRQNYNLNSIVLHTKHFAMFFGNILEGVNVEKGLTFGNLVSGTRARLGRYGTIEDCKELLVLEDSEVGKRFRDEVERLELGKEVCVVPSKYMAYPKCTIGLGDSFVAGMQLSNS